MSYTITKKPFKKEYVDYPNLVDGYMNETVAFGLTTPVVDYEVELESGIPYTLTVRAKTGIPGYYVRTQVSKMTSAGRKIHIIYVYNNDTSYTVEAESFIPRESGTYHVQVYVEEAGAATIDWVMLQRGVFNADNNTVYHPPLTQMCAEDLSDYYVTIPGQEDGTGWSDTGSGTLSAADGILTYDFEIGTPSTWEALGSSPEFVIPESKIYRIMFEYRRTENNVVLRANIVNDDSEIVGYIMGVGGVQSFWMALETRMVLSADTYHLEFFGLGGTTDPVFEMRNFSIVYSPSNYLYTEIEWFSTWLATGNEAIFELTKDKFAVLSAGESSYSPATWELTVDGNFDGVEGGRASLIYDDGTVDTATIIEKTEGSPDTVILDLEYDADKTPAYLLSRTTGLRYTAKITANGEEISNTVTATPDNLGVVSLDISPILRTLITEGHDGLYLGTQGETGKSGYFTVSFAEIEDNTTEPTYIEEGLIWKYVDAVMPESEGGNLLEYDPMLDRTVTFFNSFTKGVYVNGKSWDISFFNAFNETLLVAQIKSYNLAKTQIYGSDYIYKVALDTFNYQNKMVSLAFLEDYLANNADHFTIQVNSPELPTVDWQPPDDITYPTPLSSTQLNATASIATWNPNFDLPLFRPAQYYYPPSGTVLPVGEHILAMTTMWSYNYEFNCYKFITKNNSITVNP